MSRPSGGSLVLRTRTEGQSGWSKSFLSPRQCASTTSGGGSAETGRPIEHTHQPAQNFVSEHLRIWGPQLTLAEVKSLERKRERERETAGGGLANCQGKEDGWGAGGWSWRRKRYGRFCPKIPVPNAFFRLFSFLGVGICGNSHQGA